LLTILLIRGVTLEGARQGIIFYLKPDFSRLADARVGLNGIGLSVLVTLHLTGLIIPDFRLSFER